MWNMSDEDIQAILNQGQGPNKTRRSTLQQPGKMDKQQSGENTYSGGTGGMLPQQGGFQMPGFQMTAPAQLGGGAGTPFGQPVPQQPSLPVAGLRSFLPQVSIQGPPQAQPQAQQGQGAFAREVLADPELQARIQKMGSGNITLGPPTQRGNIALGPPAQQGQVPMPKPHEMMLQPGPNQETIIDQLLDKRFGATPQAFDAPGMQTIMDPGWQQGRQAFREQLTATPQDLAREHYLLSKAWGPEAANLAMEATQQQRNMMQQLLGRDRQNELGYAEEGGRRFGTVLNANNEATKNQLVADRNNYERSAQALMAPALLKQIEMGTFDPAVAKDQARQLERMGYNGQPMGSGAIGVYGKPGPIMVGGAPGTGTGLQTGGEIAGDEDVADEDMSLDNQMRSALSSGGADGKALLESLNGPKDAPVQLTGKQIIQKLRETKGEEWIRNYPTLVRKYLESKGYDAGKAKNDTTTNTAEKILSLPVRAGGHVPSIAGSAGSLFGGTGPDMLAENWDFTQPLGESWSKATHSKGYVSDEDLIRQVYGIQK